MQCTFAAICALAAETLGDVDHDASITASAMPRCGELGICAERGFLDYLMGKALEIPTNPESPYPRNLGGAISPPNFRGWSVRNSLFYSVLWGPCPLNFGGEIATP